MKVRRRQAWVILASLLGGLLGHGAVAAADVDGGQTAYVNAGCVACHQQDAKGSPGMFPRLAGRVGEIAETDAGQRYLVSVIAFGLSGRIDVDGQPILGLMPGHPHLDDGQIAAILNWLARLDSDATDDVFTAEAIKALRATPMTPSEVHRLRDDVLPKHAAAAHDAPAAATEQPSLAAADQPRWHPDPDWQDNPASIAERKYRLNCSGCHGVAGDSTIPAVPALANFSGYFAHTERGREFLIRSPGNAMSILDDEGVAMVTNWFLQTLSAEQLPDDFEPFTTEEVSQLRAKPFTYAYVDERREIVAQLRDMGVMPAPDALGQQKQRWVLSATPASIPLDSGVTSRSYDGFMADTKQGIW